MKCFACRIVVKIHLRRILWNSCCLPAIRSEIEYSDDPVYPWPAMRVRRLLSLFRASVIFASQSITAISFARHQ